jgi:beta-galactosidase
MTVLQLHPATGSRSEPAPFRLGVNYWPAAKGVTLWKHFDIDEVHSDMNAIAELGLDLVRVHLTWEDFQPEPEGVNCCALARLTALCDAVAAEGLKVIVTLNMGHYGGHNWAPPWLLDSQAMPFGGQPVISGGQRVGGGYRDPCTDPMARKAALRLLRAVARTLGDHQAIWAYDLGNEPHRFLSPADRTSQRDWYTDLAEALRSLDDTHAITCGLCATSLYSNTAWRVDDAFVSSTFASIQVSLEGLELARGALDADLTPFSCALTSALSNKPCFASDWGVSTAPVARTDVGSQDRCASTVSEWAAADFAEKLLPSLMQAGALGALLGNYSDIDGSLYDCPPYDRCERERSRGLIRVDGTTKPHGQVVRRFTESNPLVRNPPVRRAALNMSPDEFYANPQLHARRLYETFLTRRNGHGGFGFVEPDG